MTIDYICAPTTQACLRRRYSPYCRFITVSRATPQVYLTVTPAPASGVPVTFNHDSVYLELRRKGCEGTLLATYPAWRRDANGAIGFYFDDTLFDFRAGFFIGDVYINGAYCFSVQLWLHDCEATVVDCYVQPLQETCGLDACVSVVDTIGLETIGGGPYPESVPYFDLNNPLYPQPAALASGNCTLDIAAIG